MNYKAPFTATAKAIYRALTSATEVGIDWYDAAVPIEEIKAKHLNNEEFCYGILGQSRADPINETKDAIVWDSTITLEVYSNYKGRKVVANKLEAILNYFCGDTTRVLEKVLYEEGYGLISINVSPMQINQPMYLEVGTWQSGLANVTFRLQQLK